MAHDDGPSAGPRLHIALFLPNLSGGGVERSVLTMAAGFRERGHRVDLLVAHARGAFAERVPDGVRVFELGHRLTLPGRLRVGLAAPEALGATARPLVLPLAPNEAVGALPGLVRYLRRERPDVLFSAKVTANLVALLARRHAGGASVVVVSERGSFADKVARSPRWRWRYVAPAIRRLYPEADAIVAVSRGTAESFAQVTGRAWPDMRVIYNPVVGPDLEAQARADPGHPWFGADRGAPVVLGVGRLEARKGFDVLIRAVARVRRSRAVRLVILGEGPDREALGELARAEGVAEAVDLAGWTSNPFAFMARADLFVLASDYEGLPGVLIQAMACGCPVVSTDCPDGPREILADGRYGALVPPRDPEAMAGAIAAALGTPADRDALRARAADFRVDTALDAYESLFRAVIARKGAQTSPPTP
jgi:glycosyltransferase involved in cell wall biosynthesis